eukprot:CAMPEP_0171998642 /NCGR_PEP_ID=MMETSP1041-20130122/1348_1 /TAXON_ID=464988 /ORGANISM="Hemiselmis andersenii, Strain CCMP439" /LENGTH=85 /DNA_ID=CAMNT_0012652035 /DNA_START=196 /DNA_END=449 /DNA_ORIENTATION=+
MGPSPRQKPVTPSFFRMDPHTRNTEECAWSLDCSTVLTTSNGHVIVAPIIPPDAPPMKWRHCISVLGVIPRRSFTLPALRTLPCG